MDPADPHRPLAADLRLLSLLAIIKVALHLPWLDEYGHHRDELYFLSAADRLDFGYADFAPLVAWIAAASRAVLGDSLVALRIVPMLAGVATIFVTGLLVRALGGRRLAIWIASLSVMFAPVFLRTGNMLHVPSFEPLFWTSAALVLVHLLHRGPGPRWLLFGAIAGLGLLNKHTMLLFGLGVAIALVATRLRTHLWTRWPWLGLVAALIVFSPNLVWQAVHGWPTITFAKQLNETVMARIDSVEFLAGQVIYHGPVHAIVWLAGLVWLCFGEAGRYRGLAWIYVGVVGTLLITGGKIYYASPVYPMLFAAGAVAWERRLRRMWSRATLVTAVAGAGAAFVPLSLPVLPIDKVDRFAQTVTFGLVANSHEVTGDLHDMFSWEEHARFVAATYRALPEADRRRCFLFAGNYGEAGALEQFWPGDDRPPVASNHMSWHYWGPPPGEWETCVALALSSRRVRAGLLTVFEEVEEIARSPGHPQAIERDVAVFLCRRPRGSLSDLWPDRPNF